MQYKSNDPPTARFFRARRAAVPLLAWPVLAACMSSFGASPAGERQARIETSDMYSDGEFVNRPAVAMIKDGAFWAMTRRQLFGDEVRVPPGPLPVVRLDPADFAGPPRPGLRAIWFGHSSVLVEIAGKRVFTDPVFSERVSPFESLGPQRFFAPPLALEDLPQIDAVVISHDHYDHLDMRTVKHLAGKGTRFFVPLGIGAHLERWEVPAAQIVELEWWQSAKLDGLEIVCTPAVHYSGRGLFGGNETLWSSWVLRGGGQRFFHSGDTGYAAHFAKIGERYGPFDLTSIKVGAYDWTWEDIHMNPEQAVQAHKDLRGRRLLPVHWATFNLAIHRWDEPIVRTRTAADEQGVDLVTPRPGEPVNAGGAFASAAWWQAVAAPEE